MADKNPIDSALAASIHQAEYETGKANADSARPDFMSNALVWLDLAKQDLFTSNPNNEF